MGPGHNHATIRDAKPDAFDFMRVGGKIVVNQGYDPSNPRSVERQRKNEAAVNVAMILRKALHDAIRWNTMGFRR